MIHNITRREFIKTSGMAAAGLLLGDHLPLAKGNQLQKPKVALANAYNYKSKEIRKQIEQMFNAIGGIKDIVSSSAKVAIKINITGGIETSAHPKNRGLPAVETYWTHPEIVKSVAELIIDAGVSPAKLYFVEALWDYETYKQPGYADIQKYLGVQLVDLNRPHPYPDFMKMPVKNGFFYDFFHMNPILSELDTLVSVAKMKEHSLAGVTLGMKNLYGIVPMHKYQYPGMWGYRSALHHENGEPGEHVPRTICDLNIARPIHLSIIDGIKSSLGGEAPWCEKFVPHAFNALVAGKDPVAADSVAGSIMDFDPLSQYFKRPSNELALNHLKLAAEKKLGQNNLSNIEIIKI